MNKTRVAGWGRSSWSLTNLTEDLPNVPGAYITRGLGRSYGDCAAVTGGTTLINQGHHEMRFDDDLVSVGASVSLETLLATAMARGLFLPVSPGTRYVTIGGAVAADVHGKNHHRSGSFGDHVEEIELALPGKTLRCSRDSHPDLFWATIGGMGLTGVITEIRLRLKRVSSPLISRRDIRAKNFNDLVKKLGQGDQENEYSVAWIDTLARGGSFGRGVVTLGNHEDVAKRKMPPAGKGPTVSISRDLPTWILTKSTMKAFNAVWYSARPRESVRRHANPYPFFYPLDSIGQWNRIYGNRGFIQYQFVVPSEKINTLEKIVADLSKKSVPVFLSVLKRFGPGNKGLMSFPIEGWTLAIDIPTDFPGLNTLLDDFDERVIEAEGRVYLAKDSRLSQGSAEQMYPEIDRFRQLRNQLGIRDLIQSDLSKRLSL